MDIIHKGSDSNTGLTSHGKVSYPTGEIYFKMFDSCSQSKCPPLGRILVSTETMVASRVAALSISDTLGEPRDIKVTIED